MKTGRQNKERQRDGLRLNWWRRQGSSTLAKEAWRECRFRLLFFLAIEMTLSVWLLVAGCRLLHAQGY